MQFVSHRWVENKQVPKKTTAVWPKIKTVIDYWKELLKSKKPSGRKPGANFSYDRLCAALNNPHIP